MGQERMEILKPILYITSFTKEACLTYISVLDAISSAYGPNQHIVLQIESEGGSVIGFNILYEFIKSLPNPIITYTTGVAMSAGIALFSSVASKGCRVIGENAVFMIHEAQIGQIGGDIKEVREQIVQLEFMNKNLMDILAKSMGLASGSDIVKLIRERSQSLELNLTPKQVLELNLADRVGPVNVIHAQDNPFLVSLPRTVAEVTEEQVSLEINNKLAKYSNEEVLSMIDVYENVKKQTTQIQKEHQKKTSKRVIEKKQKKK